MERKFPIILCELRKERGLSQKEAAAMLGVSQALLSHYEKGIRECGQEFLIKVADFYDVSCDYLLGRTKIRDRSSGLETLLTEAEDHKLSPNAKTYIKAGIIASDFMKSNDSLSGVKFDTLIGIGLYKVLLAQAEAGNIPKNWVGKANINGTVCNNPMYLGIAEYAAFNALKPTKSKKPIPDAPVPEPIRVMVSTIEDFIFKSCTESIPPIPTEFLK